MLSDEEREAIETLRDREYDFDELYCTFRQSFIKPYDKAIGIILELIEKQSKEIEEINKTLKCTQDSWFEDTQKIEEMKKQIDLDNECEIALNSKIMDLEKEIEELKEKNRQSKMRIVQLENEITARIEDVNQYYTPNDKIKAKIKELENDPNNLEEHNCLRADTCYVITVLQSLLEKE